MEVGVSGRKWGSGEPAKGEGFSESLGHRRGKALIL